MNIWQRQMYFLHGTLGAGKSHLLAALTCLLIKQGHKVVYLPDCRVMLRNPFGYLQFALRFAFHNQEERATFLDNAKSLEDLEKFCHASAAEERLLFIIDQANALDPQDENDDRLSLDVKRQTRTLLDKITAEHLKLASSSGNYKHALHDRYRQTGERRLYLYGGLTDVCTPSSQ